MNIIALLTSLLIGQTSADYSVTHRTTISAAEGNQIANSLNEVRSGVVNSTQLPPSIGSRYVTYNTTLQSKMDTWFNSVGPSGYKNGDMCWVQGDICGSMIWDPIFTAERLAGWGWYLFDSTNDRPNDVVGIFNFRTRFQRPCFDYSRCNPDPNYWYKYLTCQALTISPRVRLRCRNFNNYLPPLLIPGISQIACKLTGKPGPYNQLGQPNSFYCLIQHLGKDGKPFIFDSSPTDQPYKAANNTKEICSDCPDDAKQCFENLCIAKLPPTNSPTFIPTKQPTRVPTKQPTRYPTLKPTLKPTPKQWAAIFL